MAMLMAVIPSTAQNYKHSKYYNQKTGHLDYGFNNKGVDTYYGKSHILHGVSLQVERGEVVGLLGRNYSGYFPVGDTAVLARLLNRVETNPDFLARLRDEFPPLSAATESAWDRRRFLQIAAASLALASKRTPRSVSTSLASAMTSTRCEIGAP